jgi:hypothetical protein
VVRDDEQRGRIRKGRVFGQHLRIHVSVRTDERQIGDALVQRSRNVANGGHR